MLASLIQGIVTGSVYGLISTGLLLTYRTSGIFNFAFGALGTASAFLFYALYSQWHLGLPLSLFVSVVVAGCVLGLGMESLANRLAEATLALQIAATIGVLLIVEAAIELIYGVNNIPFPNFLPSGEFSIGGTVVTFANVATLGLSLGLVIAVSVLLSRTRWGRAMRAVVVNRRLLALSGIEPRVVQRLAWLIGGLLAGVSGLMFAPDVGLNATVLTSLVMLGFGAAAIGGFASMPLAWIGGIVLGVAQSVITYKVSSTGVLGSLSASLPFIALFIVTLVYPKRRLYTSSATARVASIASEPRLRGKYRLILGGVVLVALILVPRFSGAQITAWTVTVALLILLLSLGLLVRTSGQISACQIAFAALGAVAFSRLTVNAGVPWLPALLLSGLIVVPVGLVLAIPAIRLSALFLALSTLGFGLTLQNMFYQSSIMFGVGGLSASAPQFLGLNGSDASYVYYIELACALVAAIAVAAIEASRLGRRLRGLSDSPRGLESLGVSAARTRVMVFALSAFLAAIAGALLAVAYGDVNGLSFDPNNSLLYLVLIVVVFGSSPWYALVAAIGVGVIPTYVTTGDLPYYLQILFGVSAVAAAYGLDPRDVVKLIPRAWRTDEQEDAAEAPSAVADGARALGHASSDQRPSLDGIEEKRVRPVTRGSSGRAGIELQVSRLSVRYGGIEALRSVSLRAPTGVITGLIGPNGAGKTTLFNACSGFVKATTGDVLLGDISLSHKSPSSRARAGLGRTFQQLELFESMTARDNLYLAAEAGLGTLGAGRGRVSARRNEARRRTERAIELCGIGPVADRAVAELPTGQRRQVELARCVSSDLPLILLDEPSAGLDMSETVELAAILRSLVAAGDHGVLLVEHDMSLVMSVCSHIYVLDFGQLIFEGSAGDVRSSDVVQRAYLGSASGVSDPAVTEA
jgi:ABC-type branched-subunit amino acid transport system ATPase component/branched-subunit amino acid ABC-type transport system permease component